MTVLIIKTGSALPQVRDQGDFEDWFARGLGTKATVVDITRGEKLPDHANFAGTVITGSAAMVSHREPWAMAAVPWLQKAVNADHPLLGVCYGHQLLAHALGGDVGPNPNGRQIGTVELRLDDRRISDPLFGSFAATIRVQTTHLESVLRPPDSAMVLGQTGLDPHHVMRFSDRVWGCQFHPEFNAKVLRGYIRERREAIAADGLDPERIHDQCEDTPAGPSLLRRFAQIATR